MDFNAYVRRRHAADLISDRYAALSADEQERLIRSKIDVYKFIYNSCVSQVKERDVNILKWLWPNTFQDEAIKEVYGIRMPATKKERYPILLNIVTIAKYREACRHKINIMRDRASAGLDRKHIHDLCDMLCVKLHRRVESRIDACCPWTRFDNGKWSYVGPYSKMGRVASQALEYILYGDSVSLDAPRCIPEHLKPYISFTREL